MRFMRYRNRVIWLGLMAAILCVPGVTRAQPNNYEVPGQAAPNIPLPIGNSRMEGGGFYTAFEFLLMKQNVSIGSQTVAHRGLYDFTGNVGAALGLNRAPGSFFGPRPLVEALNTNDLGRGSYAPGYSITMGYKFDDGTAFYATFAQLFDVKYSAGVSAIAPGYQFGNNLLGTFLSSGVVNFPSQYNGPVGIGDPGDTAIDQPAQVGIVNIPNAPIIVIRPDGTTIVVPSPPDQLVLTNQTPGNTAGIWNAADVMDIQFLQRYTQAAIGARTPIYETDYSRVYGLAGGQFNWFFERFTWRTTDLDVLGGARPEWAATYSNTLSQRMYGAFVGCGHEVYLGNNFGLSLDLTAAILLDIVKQRVKYERADDTTQAKRSQNDYAIVPNLNANLHLWWYPIQGVQMRVGYNAMTFFNTWRMDQAIGFDFGRIDPVYDKGYFRFLQGLDVGIGFSF